MGFCTRERVTEDSLHHNRFGDSENNQYQKAFEDMIDCLRVD